jgi:nucleoid-associated protein YgaU
MTSGTKILLAISALFVGVLVLYYGFLMPPAETTDAVEIADPVMIEEKSTPTPSFSMDPEDHAPPTVDPTPRDEAAERGQPAQTPTITPPAPEFAPPGKAVANRAVTDAKTGASGGSATLPALRPARHELGGTGAAPTRDTRDATPPPTRKTETPPPARAERTATTAPLYTRYVVRDGDTMSSIALDWFGDPNKWDLIAKANLVDPNRLRVGQVLRLPPRDATRTPPGRVGRTELIHVVAPGESLTSIARSYYGDVAAWERVHDANRTLIGNDPDRLEVGMKLVIPAAPVRR